MANPPVYPKFHPRPPLLPTPATPPTPPPTIVKPRPLLIPWPGNPLTALKLPQRRISQAAVFRATRRLSSILSLSLSLSRLDLFLPVYGETLENRVASERPSQRATSVRRFQTPIKEPIFVFDPPRNFPCPLQRRFPSNLLPYFRKILFSILARSCVERN